MRSIPLHAYFENLARKGMGRSFRKIELEESFYYFFEDIKPALPISDRGSIALRLIRSRRQFPVLYFSWLKSVNANETIYLEFDAWFLSKYFKLSYEPNLYKSYLMPKKKYV